MARYQKGINGPVSGKIGSVVGASWRGIDYLRSRSRKPQRFSMAQQAQQEKFKVVCGWIKPIIHIINVGYQHIKEGRTPANQAMSYLLKEAVSGTASDFAINFSKAILSEGTLMTSFVTEIKPAGSHSLEFHWDNAAESIYSCANDQATFVVYNPLKEEFVLYEAVTVRASRSVILSLPAGFSSDTVHGYLYFVRADGKAVSTTLYLGPLIVP
jgi:hypothetical protein